MTRFLETLLAWWERPAKWYKFWYPQSGLIGGAIMGCVLNLPLAIFVY